MDELSMFAAIITSSSKVLKRADVVLVDTEDGVNTNFESKNK